MATKTDIKKYLVEVEAKCKDKLDDPYHKGISDLANKLLKKYLHNVRTKDNSETQKQTEYLDVYFEMCKKEPYGVIPNVTPFDYSRLWKIIHYLELISRGDTEKALNLWRGICHSLPRMPRKYREYHLIPQINRNMNGIIQQIKYDNYNEANRKQKLDAIKSRT